MRITGIYDCRQENNRIEYKMCGYGIKEIESISVAVFGSVTYFRKLMMAFMWQSAWTWTHMPSEQRELHPKNDTLWKRSARALVTGAGIYGFRFGPPCFEDNPQCTEWCSKRSTINYISITLRYTPWNVASVLSEFRNIFDRPTRNLQYKQNICHDSFVRSQMITSRQKVKETHRQKKRWMEAAVVVNRCGRQPK